MDYSRGKTVMQFEAGFEACVHSLLLFYYQFLLYSRCSYLGLQTLSSKDIRRITHKADLEKEDLDNLFNELEIAAADQDNARRYADTRDFKLQATSILRAWCKRQGEAASRHVIIEALQECNLTKAVEILEKKWGFTTDGKFNIEF